MKMRLALAAAFLFHVGIGFAGEAEIKIGRDLARDHCTRCHVVGDLNPHGGISSTPSFGMMVKYLNDWRSRFETFYSRNPHQSIVRFEGFEYEGDPPTTVPIEMKIEEVEALLAFVETFDKKK